MTYSGVYSCICILSLQGNWEYLAFIVYSAINMWNKFLACYFGCLNHRILPTCELYRH